MEQLYMMVIEKGARYHEVGTEVIERHTEHISRLDRRGSLALCGPLTGHIDIAGMVILKAQSLEEAENICKADPLITGGYATYRLRAM